MNNSFQKFKNGWKKFANRLGRIQTVVLVTLFYFLILTPLGALYRLFGWDPLLTKGFKSKKPGNWRDVPSKSHDIESLKHLS